MYSQFEEEVAILKALEPAPPHKGEPTNKFLDIGAWHPTTFSNTRALVEKGWSGVLVEPSPGPLLNLLLACVSCGTIPESEYGNRHRLGECKQCGCAARYGRESRLTIIGAAVGLTRAIVPLQITDDALSTITGSLSYQQWEKEGGFYGQVWYPTITLVELFHQFGGDWGFVNFDVEGQSAELFMQMLEIGPRPRCVCVEHDNRIVEVESRAQRAGYKTVYTNGTNLVLAL